MIKIHPPLLRLLFILAFLMPGIAFSDQAWPIITFTCDKSKNEVKLKNEVIWGHQGKNFTFSAKKGTYNPWDLVKIENRGKRKLISEKQQLKLKCKLGRTEYAFIIKPKIFDTNYNTRCGNKLSVKVSIYKNSSILIEDKEMEKFCRGNSPSLRGIKVSGKNSKVKMYEVSRSRFY